MFYVLAAWEIKLIDVGSAHFIINIAANKAAIAQADDEAGNMLIEMRIIGLVDPRERKGIKVTKC